MEASGKVPVSLPRANPTLPFWQESPDAAVADLQSTPQLPAEVDVVIVGSGITGASIAWHLQKSETSKSLLMLEARQAASGATGRNGGHTKAASYRSFLDHAAKLGTPAAVQIARLELDAIHSVHGLAAGTDSSPSIPCDSNPCETLDVIYDEVQWAHAKKAVAAMRAAMPQGDPAAEYSLYERDEALRTFACADFSDKYGDKREQKVQGVVKYVAGSVSAYKFTVGVLKQCLAQGLNLQTNTPVLEVAKKDAKWLVKTARGVVTAKDVVLATNGYTAALVPELQGVVVPLRGQISMHRVGSKMPVLPTTYSFIYDGGYEYMITRPPGSERAGDMVIGGGLKYADSNAGASQFGSTDDTTLSPRVSAYLHEIPVAYFGREQYWGADDAAGRVRSEWTGIMGYTPDTYPLVGQLSEGDKAGLWLCCAFQGHGMVYSWPCGRAAAGMILGQEAKELKEWFPESFRVSEARLQLQFGTKL